MGFVPAGKAFFRRAEPEKRKPACPDRPLSGKALSGAFFGYLSFRGIRNRYLPGPEKGDDRRGYVPVFKAKPNPFILTQKPERPVLYRGGGLAGVKNKTARKRSARRDRVLVNIYPAVFPDRNVVFFVQVRNIKPIGIVIRTPG